MESDMCYSIMVESALKKLENEFSARILDDAFVLYRLRSEDNPKKFKPLEKSARIYPNYWAPVITRENNERVIRPMRYRVRPSWSEKEIPSKYNLFNARLDGLDGRRTWKGLFMKRHGILVFQAFFEWVTDPHGKKVVVKFFPDDNRLVCAPVLYDIWIAPDKQDSIISFAVLTTEPTAEVAAVGHDRSPIFLRASNIDLWLNPKAHSREQIFKVLNDTEPVKYLHEAAAA